MAAKDGSNPIPQTPDDMPAVVAEWRELSRLHRRQTLRRMAIGAVLISIAVGCQLGLDEVAESRAGMLALQALTSVVLIKEKDRMAPFAVAYTVWVVVQPWLAPSSELRAAISVGVTLAWLALLYVSHRRARPTWQLEQDRA